MFLCTAWRQWTNSWMRYDRLSPLPPAFPSPHWRMMQITSLVLKDAVVVDAQKRFVMVPKVCTWYMPDFTPKKTISSAPQHAMLHASPIHCVYAILPYLNPKHRASLFKLLSEGTPSQPNVSVRFDSYNFRCRTLEMYHAGLLLGATSTPSPRDGAAAAVGDTSSQEESVQLERHSESASNA